MRILFVSPRICYPLDTGAKIRTYHLLKGLVKEHEVILLTFMEEGLNYELKKFGEGAKEIYSVRQPPIGLLYDSIRLGTSLIGGLPASIQRYSSYEMAKKIRELSSKVDIVHFDHIHTAQYIEEVKSGVFKNIDEHNVEWIISKRLSKGESNPILKLLYLQQSCSMRKYEKNRINLADMVTCCSEFDRERLLKLSPDKRIEVIPNGVDIGYFSEELDPIDENHIVFTGSMDWLPNVEGAIWFYEKVLPLLKLKLDRVKVYIVGRAPLKKLKELHNPPEFTVTGTVPDIRPYYKNALCLIVPLLSGGGTRLKILEAMAAGCPVVSTKVGAEGINVENEKNLLIADSPEEFSSAIVRLKREKELRERLINEGRKLVEENYSWEIISKRLAKIYSEI